MEQTLGKRISTRRKALKLTQEQVAEKLGVTAQAVSKWENDQSCPDISTLPRLAELLQCTTDQLLGMEKVYEGEAVHSKDEPHGDGLHIGSDGFSFSMQSKHSVAIAVLVLTVGGLTLASELLDWDASFWSILWPTALLVYGLFGIFPRFSFPCFGCLVFGGYFLLNNLNVLPFALGWELALPLILILFGISLLVDALRKPKHPAFTFSSSSSGSTPPTSCFSIDKDTFQYSASFCDDHRMISMDRLAEGTVNTSFGKHILDLAEVEALADDCVLEINGSFGEVILLIPSRYQIVWEKHAVFADVSVRGTPDSDPQGTIRVIANLSFGELVIKYT